jgi:hypothetical protein
MFALAFVLKSQVGAPSAGFVGVKRGAHLLSVGSMGADRFVELVARDTELLGPVCDVRGHLGIDLLRVVRTFDVFLMRGVRFVSLGGVVVLGHGLFLPRFF